MKKQIITKTLSVGLITTLTLSSLTGCKFGKVNASDLDLVSQMTRQEVIDYNAKGLKYDAKVVRTGLNTDNSYEKYEITGSTKTYLENTVKKAEQILGMSEYPSSDGKTASDVLLTDSKSTVTKETKDITSNEALTENTYKYIKACLDDLQLSDSKIEKIEGARGYYFIDVSYKVGARKEVGTFKNQASLLGIHGAFYVNKYNKDAINSSILETLKKSLNEYYSLNNLDYVATSTNDSITTGQDEDNRPTYILGRTTGINTALLNEKGGQFTENTAYFPNLTMTFNVPAATDSVSGQGIYPSGEFGLKAFKYNRSEKTGACKIRYVYREKYDGTNKIEPVQAYLTEFKLTNGANVADGNVLIPDYLETQLEALLDRSDRIQINCDAAGAMKGKVYSDIGIGVLRGYLNESTKITGYTSKINQILSRDIANKAYLLEVETTTTEASRDANTGAATYKDTYYVVMQQNGTDFIITDMARVERELISEPAIESEEATLVRLNALNLTGAVTEDNKKAAKDVLNDWYNAGTFRILRGPEEVTTSSGKQTLERGMYDCFTSDKSMLSSSQLEYIQSLIRNKLVAKGVNVGATYSGTVTEWLGGSDKQIEFTTEELITYDKGKDAQYMKCYYLLSNIDDKWYITQMSVIDSDIIEGNQLSQVQGRIK